MDYFYIFLTVLIATESQNCCMGTSLPTHDCWAHAASHSWAHCTEAIATSPRKEKENNLCTFTFLMQQIETTDGEGMNVHNMSAHLLAI